MVDGEDEQDVEASSRGNMRSRTRHLVMIAGGETRRDGEAMGQHGGLPGWRPRGSRKMKERRARHRQA